MNYRSVVILGQAEEISGEDKNELLEKLSDGLVPGRTLEVRKSTNKELAATTLLAISLAEASVKIRSGMPHDDEGAGTGVWAGVIPLELVAGEPIAADEESQNLPIPNSVHEFRKNPKG
jgi:hypothetical protein